MVPFAYALFGLLRFRSIENQAIPRKISKSGTPPGSRSSEILNDIKIIPETIARKGRILFI